MNFIAATVELRSIINDPINAYGLEYRGADAVIPAANTSGEVKLRALCFNRGGPKLDTFLDWKTGTRALVTGYLVFSDDIPLSPLTSWSLRLNQIFPRHVLQPSRSW